jgi:K+-transporting ATPase ATPase B chain
MLDSAILRRAVGQAFVKLNPRHMMGNPVIFAVEVGSVVNTVEFIAQPSVFVGSITFWLWATVLFANFAEAVAEGRGKAQADTLRRTRLETVAYVQQPDGTIGEVAPSLLQVGDHCEVQAGQIIPGDGDVIEGIATVDELCIRAFTGIFRSPHTVSRKALMSL